jgi:predicted TIM-barrel fold metal-dependent hydrolase
VTKVSAIRTVALEEAFLHQRVWDLFPSALQQKYQPVRARLSDVGPERIRQMDAAGIDVQVLSHVQPGVQVLADDQVELAVAVSREVNDWLAEVVAGNRQFTVGLAVAGRPKSDPVLQNWCAAATTPVWGPTPAPRCRLLRLRYPRPDPEQR